MQGTLTRYRDVLIKMFRYGLISVIALGVDWGTMAFLKEWGGWGSLAAAPLAFSLGLLTNFVMSKYFVFGESHLNRGSEIGLFFLVGITGLGINQFIIWGLEEQLGWHWAIAKFISTGIVFLWNFFLRQYLIYTPSKKTVELLYDEPAPIAEADITV